MCADLATSFSMHVVSHSLAIQIKKRTWRLSSFVAKIFTKDIISFFKFIVNFTEVFQFFYPLIHVLVKRNIEVWFEFDSNMFWSISSSSNSKTQAVDINLHLQAWM